MAVSFGARPRSQTSKPGKALTSAISGDGLYVFTGNEVTQHGNSYLEVGAAGGGAKYLALAVQHARSIEYLKRTVQLAMGRSGFIWPIDVAKNEDDAYLIMPILNDEGYHTLSEYMSNVVGAGGSNKQGKLAAEQSEMRLEIARMLLNSWDRLHVAGCLYLGLNPDHIYYHPGQHAVLFGFNLDIELIKENPSLDDFMSNWYAASAIRPVDYSLDYADPYSYFVTAIQSKGASPLTAFRYTDWFAENCMAFRLLVGLLPYAGPLVAGVANDSPDAHQSWLERYQRNPVFIFDSMNHKNSLEGNPAYEVYIDNWRNLPEDLRERFTNCFDSSRRPASLLGLPWYPLKAPSGWHWDAENQSFKQFLVNY